MEEADKYKQRLEAIAEKLRRQEEQEKARREMEEERLRLQQLKRKSLRDQWLMEGAPLSPASPDTQNNPRSPPWGSEAQEMEERDDQCNCGLQSESQRLTEEEDNNPMENRQTEAAEMGEADAGSYALLQNIENNVESGDGVFANQRPLPEESATLLTDHRGEAEASSDSLDSSQSSSSGTVAAPVSRDGLRTSVSEGGAAPNPKDSVEEEELALMVEECAIGADGEDEEPKVNEGEIKGTQSETDLQKQEVEEEEIKREAEEKHEAAPAGEEMKQPVPAPLGATVVSTGPVYSRSNSISERGTAVIQEGADIALESQEPPPPPGQFQEVFLVDPQNNKRTEGMPGEQDSLLSQAKTPKSPTEPAAADTSAQSEPRSHEEQNKMSKNRTGLCCTLI
eukprot:XP_011611406.1 PREDICTED: paralemmin-3-like isoform X2 [Takifugu rubripes]